MNSVHEPGSNGDLETLSSRKPSRVHEHPTGPASPACAHRPRAGGCVVGGSGRVVVGPPGRVAVLRVHPKRYRAPPAARPCSAPAPAHPSLVPACPARLLRAPRACCAVSWAWLDVSRPCVVTQSSSLMPLLPRSRYSNCIVTQPSHQPIVSRYSAVL